MKRLTLFLSSFLLLLNSLLAQTVVFNHSHGFCNSPFVLTMTVDEGELTAGQTIHYTLDGRIPTPASATYTKGINISKNTILRAAIINADTLASAVTTATYLFANDVLKQSNSPKGYPTSWGPYAEEWGNAKADYEMDPEMTSDATLKPKILAGLTAIPTLSIVTDKDNFFSNEIDEEKGGIYIYTGAPVGDGLGRDWERPISMELFGGEQQHDLTVDCGVKIHGGHSRLPEKTPKHSLRIMFKEKYGPSKLKYRIFGEEGPKKFDQLVLRCAFGNTWQHWDNTNRKRAQYSRDMWARNTQRLMGHPSSRGLYVHVYINGMYWGLYNIAERIDDYYCSSNFGGEKTDYDVIKVEEYQSGHTIEPADGTLDKWSEMVRMAGKASTTYSEYAKLIGVDSNGNRDEQIEPLLDVDNFIDFMLINQYGGNTDWDHHNWLAFRNRTTGNEGFKFICWDSELIFGEVGENILDKVNSGAPTYIFDKLMNHAAFRRRFIDRAYKHLEQKGGMLTPDRVIEVWDSLYHIIETPLYDEAARWGDYRRDVHPYNTKGDLYTVDGRFKKERIRLLDTYFPDRTEIFINQLMDKGWYTRETMPQVRINGKIDEDTDTISIDDVVTFKISNVTYFTLDGSEPYHWYANSAGKKGSTAIKYVAGSNLLKDYDWTNGNKITIRALGKSPNGWTPTLERTLIIRDLPDGMDEIIAQRPTHQEGIYDLSGRRMADDSNLTKGIYIINGKKVWVK